MTKEDDYCNSPCLRGICRRDFLKLAVAAGLLSGCGAEQQPNAAPPDEPTATPTCAPTGTADTVSAEDFSQVAYCGIRCREACPEHTYPTSCEGCKSEGGKLGHFCERCAIRKCAMEKQVVTCAHCDEYPSCDVDTWKMYPVLRRKIDGIRSTLEAQPDTSADP
jgi:hypothetical protein